LKKGTITMKMIGIFLLMLSLGAFTLGCGGYANDGAETTPALVAAPIDTGGGADEGSTENGTPAVPPAENPDETPAETPAENPDETPDEAEPAPEE